MQSGSVGSRRSRGGAAGIWADGDNQNENIASVNNQDVQQDAQDAEDKGHASTCNMQQ